MAKKKTRAEIETELRLLKGQRRGETVALVVNNLVRWSGLVLIAYFCYLAIDSLAGKQTAADIGLAVGIITDVRVSTISAWALAVLSAVYGFAQRRLRRNTIELFQGQIRSMEQHADPARSSSGLTARGDTHPEDH